MPAERGASAGGSAAGAVPDSSARVVRSGAPALPTTREGASRSLALELDPALRVPLGELLLGLADDEFVLGFLDSEWTGIAPILEEDVAMSSIAQDELGHARALYELLGALTGRDPDAIAYDRPVESFRHARLLDPPRTDWAVTIARRWLYDTADAARLESLAGTGFRPLADLVAKIRREETYHLLHAAAWLRRLATAGGEARDRLVGALERLLPDAPSVLAPPPGQAELLAGGLLVEPFETVHERWADAARAALDELGLPSAIGPPEADWQRARPADRPAAFHWLYGEFTSVRRIDPEATW